MFKKLSSVALAAAIAASSSAYADTNKQYQDLAEQMEALQAQMNQLQSAEGDMMTEQAKGKPLTIKGRILTEYINVFDADGNTSAESYLNENGGDLRVASARLYFSGQSEAGLDYKLQLRVNNRGYDEDGGMSSTIKEAWVGYEFENGTYTTFGRFLQPTAAGVSEYSSGTLEYLTATFVVTDRMMDGIDFAIPVGDMVKLNAYAGQAVDGDTVGNLNGTSFNGTKVYGLTSTFNVAENHAVAIGGFMQNVLFEDSVGNWDSEYAHALEVAYMGSAGPISTTLAFTHVMGDDNGRAAAASDLGTLDNNDDATGLDSRGRELEDWNIIHGYVHFAIPGAAEEGWFHSPGVFVEGNYLFGGDIQDANLGYLVGFEHGVLDIMDMVYEYHNVGDTGGVDRASGNDDDMSGLFVRSTVKF